MTASGPTPLRWCSWPSPGVRSASPLGRYFLARKRGLCGWRSAYSVSSLASGTTSNSARQPREPLVDLPANVPGFEDPVAFAHLLPASWGRLNVFLIALRTFVGLLSCRD